MKITRVKLNKELPTMSSAAERSKKPRNGTWVHSIEISVNFQNNSRTMMEADKKEIMSK